MIKTIIGIILFTFLIDGIKILFESFFKYKKKEYFSEHWNVTVVIPMFNAERMIGAVVRKAKRLFSPKNIIVVNDGSTDGSLDAVRAAHPDVQIHSFGNSGKVRAIEKVLPFVRTKYTLLLDADVFLPEDFRCPTSLIKDGVTAVAFNVIPGHGDWNVALKLQSYEYARSMTIGRKYQDKTKSVSCVSGAIGLFKTARLAELTKRHSRIWAGEDFERTLIELVAGGEVTFVDRAIETETPRTFWGIIKQRVLGWWPGLWRNIPLLFKVMVKKQAPLQLRWEMGYLLFSLFTDPLKLIALMTLIMKERWLTLVALYLVYLMLEMVIWFRLRTQTPQIAVLFFFYNFFQIILRVLGLGYFILGKFVRNKWTSAVVGAVCIALLFPCSMTADDGILAVSYQKVLDSNGRRIDNCNLYFGYKGAYLDLSTARGAPRYLILGQYIKQGRVLFVPEMRLGEHYKSIHLTAKYPVNRVVLGFSTVYAVSGQGNYPIVRGGFDYYWGSYNWFSANATKEFGRKRTVTVVFKNHLEYGSTYFRTEFVINDFWDIGWSALIGFKRIFVIYSSFHNFDYCDFDREYLGAGVKINF